MRISLAQNILDAMRIVRSLGLRYLWVDALCIVQDDSSQKHRDIANMAKIYRNALLTIVADGSVNANDMLLRSRQQKVSSDNILATIPFGTFFEAVVQRNPLGESSELTYNKRAWTYQEIVFSRRRLIIGSGRIMRWECPGACWYEHVTEFSSMFNAESPKLRYRRYDVLPKFGVPNSLYLVNDLTLRVMIERFSHRALTYDEDVLDAFQGPDLEAISQACALISGLPEAMFSMALL